MPLDMIPISFLGMGYKVLTKLNHATGLYDASAMISNMGRIDIRKLCGAGFETDTVFVITPSIDKLPMVVTLVECVDREEVVISIPKGLGSHNRFERLLMDVAQAVSPPASLASQTGLEP